VLVTEKPAQVSREHVDGLRRHGWSDEAIHDAIQVVSFFNYINRVADAVGIDPEPGWEEEADRATTASPTNEPKPASGERPGVGKHAPPR
jgi:hypothetical protein